MMFRTHVALGFLGVMISLPFLQPENQILFMTVALFASILPDIDHPNSKIGRHIKPINILFEHRGFFHSIFPLVLFAYLLTFYSQIIYIAAFVIGYTSHLIGDLITKKGIMPIHPLLRTRIRGFMITGSLIENIIFMILVLTNILLLVNL